MVFDFTRRQGGLIFVELLLMMLVVVLILGLGGGNMLKVLFHVFMTVITGGFWLLVLVIAFLVNHK